MWWAAASPGDGGGQAAEPAGEERLLVRDKVMLDTAHARIRGNTLGEDNRATLAARRPSSVWSRLTPAE